MKFVMGKHYHNVSLFVDGKDLAETELTALAKQYDRNGIPRITGSDLDKLLRQYTVCDGSPYKRTAVLDGVDMAKYGITGTLDSSSRLRPTSARVWISLMIQRITTFGPHLVSPVSCMVHA